MRPTPLAFAAALALLALDAAPALAQAPGNCECAAPPVVTITPIQTQGWQGQRFGVGLRLSSISLSPKSDPDSHADFAGGGLQLRYRINARWEIEGAIDGGREQLDDGSEGSTQLSIVTASAIFHLRPHHNWDVYALAGIGGAAAHAEGMDPDAAPQFGAFVLGAGVERRFRRFGIAAELRVIGLQPSEDDSDVATDLALPEGSAGMLLPPIDDGSAADDGIAGGSFSLVGNYYF
jgi:opacity protein-like surface antigen